MNKMNYSEAQAILAKLEEKGSIYGLEGIQTLLELLGNPQDGLKFVHVAGTNGKGSVIAYLASVLTQAGYRTGQYTSPAVFCRRESICIDGKPVSEGDYSICLNKIFECIGKIKESSNREPTAFEIETALAFMYFKMKSCDIVFLEVGLGGDSDATNVIKNPLCSVIMPVSLDHTNLLGNTLTEISAHKAGIIKESCPVVSSYQNEEVSYVLRVAAGEKHTQVIFPCGYEILENSKNMVFDSDFCQIFIYNGNKYEIVMPGIHQIENAVTAVEVVRILNKQGFDISQKSLVDGLRRAQWQGRFTLISREPYVIIDGAHNAAAAAALSEMMEKYVYSCDSSNKIHNVIMVAGMLSDKDYNEVIPIAARKCTRLFTVNTSTHNRQLSGEVLREVADRNNISVSYMKDVKSAVYEALKITEKNDVILAFGSFSFLAEFKRYVEENKT